MRSSSLTPFHIAIPVRDNAEARHFYGELLGFSEGRSDQLWVDYDMFGHQVVVHLDAQLGPTGSIRRSQNPVDGHQVPVPHYGVVLEMPEWESFAERVRRSGISFIVEPTIRFAGLPGEQATMFFLDPTGNALEFKSFKDIAGQLFAKQ